MTGYRGWQEEATRTAWWLTSSLETLVVPRGQARRLERGLLRAAADAPIAGPAIAVTAAARLDAG